MFLVGARGAVATTVVHGLEALRAGIPPVGMVTAGPAFAHAGLVDSTNFQVAGWDVSGDAHRTALDLMRTGVLPRDLVEMSGGLRDRLEMALAPGVPEPEDAALVDRASADRLALSPVEMVAALRDDLRGWLAVDGVRRGVVVYLASAERAREIPEGWQDPEAEPLELLVNAPTDLSRSLIYATAAIAEGVPFVNFTPAPGCAVPALAGWAQRQGVPVLGNDGKTGETLLKTSLAPMFRDRRMNVMSWEGYNMLGNRDGAALEEPERARAKLANKDAALHSILEDSEHLHSGVRIDFVPSLHDWKTAMDYIHFEGFLGARMSLQFTWQGSDSALAAPLVIDLARIALRAAERGEGGPLTAAAPFFKNPLGTTEHDFHRQMDMLRAWVVKG